MTVRETIDARLKRHRLRLKQAEGRYHSTAADRLRRFRKDELIEMLVELDRHGRYTTVDRVLTDREIAKSEACQARAEEETQNSIACLEAYKHAFERF